MLTFTFKLTQAPILWLSFRWHCFNLPQKELGLLSQLEAEHVKPNADILEKERETAAVFQELPFHYVEIAHVLLRHARDCFEDLYRVCPQPAQDQAHQHC